MIKPQPLDPTPAAPSRIPPYGGDPSGSRFDFPLRSGHPYIMYESLQGTPQVLAQCLEPGHTAQIRALAAEIKRREIRKVFFVGCGTSLNEGRTLTTCFEQYAGLPAKALDALEFTLYPPPDLDGRACAIAISHSGNSITTVDAAAFARQKGAYTLCMVGRPDGRLPSAGDVTLLDPGGRELNGPKMRSYTVTCFQGLLLSLALQELSTGQELISGLAGVPAGFAAYLREIEPGAKKLAEEWGPKISGYMAAGSGCDAGSAYEMALKLLETIFAPASGYDVEELTHGPLYFLRPDRAVILLQSGPQGKKRLVEAAYAASAASRQILVVAEDPRAGWPECARVTPMPQGYGPAAFLFAALPVQVLCYYLCLALGAHPDRSSANNPALQEMSARAFPPGTH